MYSKCNEVAFSNTEPLKWQTLLCNLSFYIYKFCTFECKVNSVSTFPWLVLKSSNSKRSLGSLKLEFLHTSVSPGTIMTAFSSDWSPVLTGNVWRPNTIKHCFGWPNTEWTNSIKHVWTLSNRATCFTICDPLLVDIAIKHDETKCPNGKMFGKIFDGHTFPVLTGLFKHLVHYGHVFDATAF